MSGKPPPRNKKPKTQEEIDAEEANQTWSERMGTKRVDMRLGRMEKDTADVKEMLTILSGRLPEPDRTSQVTRDNISFETPKGQAAYESQLRRATTAEALLFSSNTARASQNTLMNASYAAEGDILADLQMKMAEFTLRRSRFNQLTKRLGQGARFALLAKYIPWIIMGVLGSVLVYGITQPANFQLLSNDVSNNPRLEIAILASLVIITVSAIIVVLRQRRKKPLGEGTG